MYSAILVPLENSRTDEVILEHVRELAKHTGARLIFAHIADGFVAQNQAHMNLQDSEEIQADRRYLQQIASDFEKKGLRASTVLGRGDPATELLTLIDREQCDLVAMATHGHRIVGDVIFGSVASALRHRTSVPILMIRDARDDEPK